tara:strand:- start:8 stop:1330 length:1323 start_codon:yes stop_codon:yes gene_type:complete
MADQTYTVTVASGTLYISGGTGNVFYLNGARDMALEWVEGGTLRFDQSASSNDNHPLLFTTSTSDPGGNIISAGVTYYLDGASNQAAYTNTTTFNAATTRYVEIAPASSTDFHYYCYVHGIGMGGAIDITQNTWGAMSWGENQYGSQNHVDVLPSSLTITSAIGDLAAFPEQGWGHSTWGSEPWGESFSPVVPLTGLSMATTLGTLAYAQSIEGWGRDEYGIGGWGTNETVVEITTSLSMDMSQGPEGWGESAWGNNNWGGELIIQPESIIVPTGVSMGASVGSTTQNFDMIFGITGVSSGAAVGTLSINNGADHQQGLGSVTIGSAVGSVTDQQTYEISGVSMGSSVGSLTIDDTQLVPLSGLTIGSAVGSTTVDQMRVGLTGVTAGSAVGSTTVTDMTVGLTGIELPSNLGTVGFGALAYKDIDITSTTSYTDITHAA